MVGLLEKLLKRGSAPAATSTPSAPPAAAAAAAPAPATATLPAPPTTPPPPPSMAEELAAKWIPSQVRLKRPPSRAEKQPEPAPSTSTPVSPWSTRVRSTYPPDAALVNALRDLPGEGEMRNVALRALDAPADGVVGAGATLSVEDVRNGQRFELTASRPGSFALQRELVAQRLRKAVGQPTLPVAKAQMTLPNGAVVDGYIKPALAGARALSDNPREWSAQQRSAVLVDHLWAKLTGNEELPLRGYLVIGSEGSVLQRDWHRSLDEPPAPSAPKNARDAKPKGAPRLEPWSAAGATGAAGLLFSAWTRGAVDVDTRPAYDALDAIEKLTRRDMLHAVAPLMEATGGRVGALSTVERVTGHLMERKDALRAHLDELVRRAGR